MPTVPKYQPRSSPCFPAGPPPPLGAPRPECEALFRALVDAGSDFGELAADLSGCRTLAYMDSLPPGLVGAYVPISGHDAGFHVGIVSDVCSCDTLARIMERVRPDAEPGIRAVLMVLAQELGLRFLRRVDPALDLVAGPPVFIDGIGRSTRSSRARAAEVVFGSLRATLTLTGWDALRESDWPGRETRRESQNQP